MLSFFGNITFSIKLSDLSISPYLALITAPQQPCDRACTGPASFAPAKSFSLLIYFMSCKVAAHASYGARR